MLDFERKAKRRGYDLIVGIDEAGRGPLAGPVVASAVALKKHKFRSTIRDSKKISALKREQAFHEILDNAYVGIGIVNENIIDAINILEATYFAMSMAVSDLIGKISPTYIKPENLQQKVFLLIDGKSFKSELPFDYKTIVRGDDLSLSIACASIVAKVIRDRILKTYDRVFPQYGFKDHKGYPTKKHKAAIKNHGLSLIHRKTFRAR